MSTDELLTYLFSGQPHPLSPTLATWLTSSRRFREFATTFRAKIRKKLRSKDSESLRDLHFELGTAYLLVRERALSLVYEPPCGGKRCPDFLVTFTTSFTLMLEVTRQRLSSDITSTFAPSPLPPQLSERLARTVCSKLGQLSKLHSNVLVVGFDGPCSAQDLSALMLSIKQRAERNDPSLVQRYGFRGRADFFSHYGRLTEIFVRKSHVYGDSHSEVYREVYGEVVGWLNPEAKRPLPAKVRTALLRSHTLAE